MNASIGQKNEVLPKYIEWEVLKQQTTQASLCDDQETYQSLLVNFDPLIKSHLRALDTRSAEFIGKGVGQNTLNVFRKVITPAANVYFEKIYLKESRDWLVTLWFYTQLQPLLNNELVKVPKLDNYYEGRRISVAYFDFVPDAFDDLKRKQQVITRSLEIQKILWDTTRLNKPLVASRPKYIDDFVSVPLYSDCRNLLLAKKNQLRLSFNLNDHWLTNNEVLLSMGQKQFCHGDLHGKNLSSTGWVIDWDNIGFFPAGYDIALVLSKVKNTYCLEWLESFIDRCVLPNYPDEIRVNVKRNIIFLAAIFYVRKYNDRISARTLASLLEWVQANTDVDCRHATITENNKIAGSE
jgi:hypothetical protein